MGQGWRDVEAEVTSCGLVRPSAGWRWDSRPGFYAVAFSYEVDGTSYDGATNSPVEMQRGDRFAIRYNPEHPEENNSLESECERPWFRDYLDVSYAIFLGLLLYALVSRYLLHR